MGQKYILEADLVGLDDGSMWVEGVGGVETDS